MTKRGAALPARRSSSASQPTGKRLRKWAEIIALASQELNEHGVHGFSMADVATKAGMTKANLTYYFNRKDDLAALCFDTAIESYLAMIRESAAAGCARERVAMLVTRYFGRTSDAIQGAAPPLAILSDIRGLKEADQTKAVAKYREMLLETAALINRSEARSSDIGRTVPRAQLLLVQLFWSAAWLPRYDPSDHPSAALRLADIIADGLLPPTTAWQPTWTADAIAIASARGNHAASDRDEFFRTATGLINRLGYRGASIDRIAAAMNQTKGAIYHHFDSKDALVMACFERSFAQMWAVIRAAAATVERPLPRLFAVVVALIASELDERGPFLRATAMASLPTAARAKVLEQWNRIVLHLASIVTDGIAAGELRPVDPLLAAYTIIAGINASEEINRFIPEINRLHPGRMERDVVQLCARPLLCGVFFDDTAGSTLRN